MIQNEHITIRSVNFNVSVLGGRSIFTFEFVGDTVPDVFDEVSIEEDGTVLFGGIITDIRESTFRGRTAWIITGNGFENYLTRISINKAYENETVESIVRDALQNNRYGITLGTVGVNINIGNLTIRFSNLWYLLQDLSRQYGFLFYVDENKVLHIYSHSGISEQIDYDNDIAIIQDTLVERKAENTKINSVVVNGGIGEGEEITETLEGDGSTDTFTTIDFFALPTVSVGGVSQDVGVAGADISNYDAIWDSGTLTFATAPINNAVITITGHKKAKILLRVADTHLVEDFGKIEVVLREDAITSFGDAERLARLKISSSQDVVESGSFQTYTRPEIRRLILLRGREHILTQYRLVLNSENDGIYLVAYQTKKRTSLSIFLRKLYSIASQSGTDGTFLEIIDLDDRIVMTEDLELDNTADAGEGIEPTEDTGFIRGELQYIWAGDGNITSSTQNEQANQYPLLWGLGKWE